MRSGRIRRSRTGGLTVLEMLLTTFLLALTTMVVAEGSRSVNAVYRRTMAKADAQMVLSQIETQLREELRFAEDVDADGSGNVTAYKWHGGWCGIHTYTSSDGKVVLLYRRWVDASEDDAETTAATAFDDREMEDGLKTTLPVGVEPLSETDMASLEGIRAVLPTIAYDPAHGLFTVSGLEVRAEDGHHTLAGPMTFTVRAVSLS